jgi:type II secretory pathway pseudopilin PulG
MVEIAISLAIIGFALVAIIGVLPIGMNAQKDNREETIINQDTMMLMDAIRNGAQGLDDLTNYVMAITNSGAQYYWTNNRPTGFSWQYGYTTSNSSTLYSFPLTNGSRIVGLLSTPKYVSNYVVHVGPVYYSNHVVAYLRSMSGPAYDKFPQNSPSVQDLAFCYAMTSEVVPYGPYGTNYYYYDPSWLADPNFANGVNNLSNNLHDVRLVFRWPLRSNGQLGPGGQAFRTLIGGQLTETNEPGFGDIPYNLYFFQPRNYVNAQ